MKDKKRINSRIERIGVKNMKDKKRINSRIERIEMKSRKIRKGSIVG